MVRNNVGPRRRVPQGSEEWRKRTASAREATTKARPSSVVRSLLASFTVLGFPGGGVIPAVPVLAAVNPPVEGIGILLAVDTIPDIFRTMAYVTANVGAAVVLARGEKTADGDRSAAG